MTDLVSDSSRGAALATPRVVRAPRGTTLRCRGWTQEAALRMLMNNLDPEVAEKPGDLVVYGGTGKAARNWAAFDAIVAALEVLEDDETLLVQSGKPVGVFRTHAHAPRVLIANSNLVGRWATWDHFHELERRGLMMYGQMTAGSWIYIGTQGILQGTYEDLWRHGARPLWGIARGALDPDGRDGWHGWRTAPRGYHEWRRDPCRRGRPRADPAPDRDTLLRPHDATIWTRAVAWVVGAAGAGEALSVGLVGNCADVLPELVRRGVTPDIVTDQTSAHDPVDGYVPCGFSLEEADVLRQRDRTQYRMHSMASIRSHCEAIVAMMKRGAVAVDYGNNLRGYAREAGFEDAFAYPGFVPAYVRSLFCLGKGPFRWVALSGDPADIHRTDDLVLEMFPEDEHLCRWIRMARGAGRVPGPARTDLLVGAGREGGVWRRHERSGRERRDQRADRDRTRPPRHGVGGVTLPRNRSDEGRHGRRGGLAGPERAAEHGFRRAGYRSITAAEWGSGTRFMRGRCSSPTGHRRCGSGSNACSRRTMSRTGAASGSPWKGV